jgi:hypothetical protein
MKKLYRNIRLRMEIPSGIDVLAALFLTLMCGNITAEIVSRPINSYMQAACMLLTIALGIITLRMIALWIFEYVTNKNK